MDYTVSEIFEPKHWDEISDFKFEDITYHRAKDHGTVRIAFNRPEVRNAFRPKTVDELYRALDHARMSTGIGCVLLTGNGPSKKDGGWAFCSGGDQRIRGKDDLSRVGVSQPLRNQRHNLRGRQFHCLSGQARVQQHRGDQPHLRSRQRGAKVARPRGRRQRAFPSR